MSSKKSSDKGLVLVTGAAGAVGHFAVRHLLEDGFRVRGLDLHSSHMADVQDPRFEAVQADLTSPGTPEKAMEGVDYVIHTAALVDIGAPWEKLSPINYEATVRLFLAAKEHGTKHFVFFSTGSVYKGGEGFQTEASEVVEHNAYVRSKLWAERFLHAQTPPPTVNTLRPALIYGPWGRVLAASLAATPALLRVFGPLAPNLTSGPRSNWVHAEDVARAAVFLIENPQPHGEVFNVAGDTSIGVGDMFTLAFKTAGAKIIGPELPYPTKVVRLLNPVARKLLPLINMACQRIYRLAWNGHQPPYALLPRLDPEAMDFAVRDMLFDNNKLKSLGFTYRYPDFEQGWKETYEWYVKQGWVPPPRSGRTVDTR